MEEKYFNRYRSFCRSLRNLEKSKFADPTAEFVLEGTIRNYILTFDLAWKVMKDILVKQLEITDFAIGSPREVLQSAFTNGLISDDIWLKMLKTRNLGQLFQIIMMLLMGLRMQLLSFMMEVCYQLMVLTSS